MINKLLTAWQVNGRINRAWFLSILAATIAIWLVLSLVAMAVWTGGGTASPGTSTAMVLGAILVVYLYSLWCLVAASVRRLHDREKGWYWIVPLLLLPAVFHAVVVNETVGYTKELNFGQWLLTAVGTGLQAWFIMETWFLPGTDGANRFGSNPLDNNEDDLRRERPRLLAE